MWKDISMCFTTQRRAGSRNSGTETIYIQGIPQDAQGNYNLGGKSITGIDEVKAAKASIPLFLSDMEVKDNTILLNKGETGPGVTAGSSGLIVDRGTATEYRMIFDETSDTFMVGRSDQLQSIATRVNGINNKIPHWNDSVSALDFMNSPDLDYMVAIDQNLSTQSDVKFNKLTTALDANQCSQELVGSSHKFYDNDSLVIWVNSNYALIDKAYSVYLSDTLKIFDHPAGGGSATERFTFNPTTGLFSVKGEISTDGKVTIGGTDLILGSFDQVSRGDSGFSRAMVKDANTVLAVNYQGDFTGGVHIQSKTGIGIAPTAYELAVSNDSGNNLQLDNATQSGSQYSSILFSSGGTGKAKIEGCVWGDNTIRFYNDPANLSNPQMILKGAALGIGGTPAVGLDVKTKVGETYAKFGDTHIFSQGLAFNLYDYGDGIRFSKAAYGSFIKNADNEIQFFFTNASGNVGDAATIDIKTVINKDGKITAAKLNLTGVPTSSASLVSGDVWADNGVLKIVP